LRRRTARRRSVRPRGRPRCAPGRDAVAYGQREVTRARFRCGDVDAHPQLQPTGLIRRDAQRGKRRSRIVGRRQEVRVEPRAVACKFPVDLGARARPCDGALHGYRDTGGGELGERRAAQVEGDRLAGDLDATPRGDRVAPRQRAVERTDCEWHGRSAFALITARDGADAQACDPVERERRLPACGRGGEHRRPVRAPVGVAHQREFQPLAGHFVEGNRAPQQRDEVDPGAGTEAPRNRCAVGT
jgi:hypothetical protein